MSVLLDLIAVAIVAFFAWRGFRKGILGAVISAGITIVSAILAFVISAPISSGVYDGYVKEAVVSYVQSGFESVDIVSTVKEEINTHLGVEIADEDIERITESDDVFEELQDIASENGMVITDEEIDEKWNELVSSESVGELIGAEVPEEVVQSITDTLRESKDNVGAVVKAVFEEDSSVAAQQIEETVVRDKATALIRAASAILIFVIAGIVLRLIYFILSKIKLIPAIKKISSAAGLALGVAEGILIVTVIGIAMAKLMNVSYGAADIIGGGIIDKTFIWSLFVK